MARPSGAENAIGVAGAITCAVCNAVGTLTVHDPCRTEHSASIITWTAIFMTLMALPFLGDADDGRFPAVLLDRPDQRRFAILDDVGTKLCARGGRVAVRLQGAGLGLDHRARRVGRSANAAIIVGA